MAGYNGSGPQGKGPMTGRGRGYCMVSTDEGSFPGQWLSRCFGGRQRRKNRNNARFGVGQNAGFGGRFGGWNMTSPDSQQDLSILQKQVQNLESTLQMAIAKIEELGKSNSRRL